MNESSRPNFMSVSLPLLSEPSERADPIGENDAPKGSSLVHLFDEGEERYLFIVDRSRLFRLDRLTEDALRPHLESGDDSEVAHQLEKLGVTPEPALERLESHPVTSISLAVAQKCNLGCTYCYAQEGDFGGEARDMTWKVAQSSIDQLFDLAPPGQSVNVSFLGGEPLTNREVLQRATEHAVARSEQTRIPVRFSVTTNGTLLTPDDADFFERYHFAVTISLDGVGETHDQLRPYKGGRGSFSDVITRAEPLLTRQRNMQVSARVTVTPENLSLLETLNALIEMGFHSVGFSPMLSSPTGRGEMDGSDLKRMLDQMIACGHEFERQLVAGRRYPFSNLVTSIREIHRGTHRPYPCGAGAGYFGVSAEGGLFACHRFVDDESGSMGSVQNGVDRERQEQWLTQRHVDFQSPCSGCWARYLCGGGCHHEVIHRGRPACDYIRGWLNYCLQAYTRLLKAVPDYFKSD